LIVVNALPHQGGSRRKTHEGFRRGWRNLAPRAAQASFVPDEEPHDLRAFMRTRKQLCASNPSRHSVIRILWTEGQPQSWIRISDIMGRTGRLMIESMITGGCAIPRKLAALADRD